MRINKFSANIFWLLAIWKSFFFSRGPTNLWPHYTYYTKMQYAFIFISNRHCIFTRIFGHSLGVTKVIECENICTDCFQCAIENNKFIVSGQCTRIVESFKWFWRLHWCYGVNWKLCQNVRYKRQWNLPLNVNCSVYSCCTALNENKFWEMQWTRYDKTRKIVLWFCICNCRKIKNYI